MPRSIPAILSLLILWPPSAAVSQGSAERPFVDVIDVRVVNLEVVVVDGKGHRVSGLGPEDFRLAVDKREIPIEFFNEISQGVAVTQRPAADTSSVPGLVSGKAVGTSYLVFIDELFTRAPDRNRVLKEMAPEVWRLGPEDRMAMVAFNGRRVDMLSSWSQKPEELELAFEDAIARRARGLDTDAQIRGLETDLLADATDDPGFDALYASGRLEEKLERIARAVTSTLRGFAKPPGRKVMLLLAGGWPDSFRVSGDSGLDHSRGRRILSPIHETANLLGYTLYPIDVLGTQSIPGGAAQPGLRNIDVSAGFGAHPGVNSLELEAHATLDILAEETGGRALIDNARLTAFDRVIEDTRSYYWLGFVPDWQGDDKDHKIRVEILHPGLRVRSRESFQDLSRDKEVSIMVESALMFGHLPGAKPLQVRFGKPTKGRRLQIPLTLFIPMDEVTMLPVKKGRYEANLELRIAVLDERGDHNDLEPIPVKLFGDRLPKPGEQALYETAVKMRTQAHDIVVALYDPVSGTFLSTTGRFQW